jgi:hypothetical protein
LHLWQSFFSLDLSRRHRKQQIPVRNQGFTTNRQPVSVKNMASDPKEDEMPNWTDLVNNHAEKADAVKVAVGCALKHVTEALFDLVVRNEWRKVHGEQAHKIE